MPSVPTGPHTHRNVDFVTAVIDSVSNAENADPEDLPPLYEVIDPDALNALFAGKEDPDGKISFVYHGYNVTVRSDGQVVLESPSGP